MGDNMEKEKVLEIEIKKINNEYSAFYPIKMDIDKLTEISDGKSLGDGEYTPYIELRISGYCYEIYLTYTEIFPQVIKNNCIEELKQRIDEINKEFEVSKKWRAEEGENYYSIAGVDVIKIDSENLVELDNRRYELGNYFQTEEQAQKIINSKEWQDFWAKVRAGEIGG
ncbi:hypothetical protein FNU4_36 [Fusobacterium phage vB_FnuS_FNU4]|nr:hypothetical protein FNU4_36 [Fusobacterium phage vB_FnuS_FNU4]